MRNSLFLFLFGLIISLSSCRNDFEFQPSKGGLTFSKDTVYLDTVFTNIGSSTYRLKVYNKSDNDISIPKIQLAKGTSSKYRMMIDGLTGEDSDASGIGEGKIFNDVELLAKDSMFIFIEVTADVASANPTDFLYTDKIEFYNISGAPQTVELVTLIQDAYFIYPQRSEVDGEFLYETINLGFDDNAENVVAIGSNLDDNDPVNGDEYTWNNSKPYVIYGYAFVPDGKTLTVNPGARIHFHANSGLIISKNATLKIEGGLSVTDALENEVIFEGDRLEPDFSNVPGQWGAIINHSTSTENSINHLTIKNATVGILSQNLALFTDSSSPYLNIKNSQIYDCANIGLLARKSTIEGSNLVINNAGQATLACTYGGTYNFTHCTFNNTWPSSQQAAVLLNDYVETATEIYANNPVNNFSFTNCIIYGSNQNELLIDRKGTNAFNYEFSNCLIKSNNTNNNSFYPPTNTTNYSNCSIAKNSTLFNPKFEDESTNQLWLSEDLNLPHDTAATALVPTDIAGINRTTSTDLGAYQYVP
ncbi:hypothetical protein [Flavobacterium sp.]|uniref:hypothetical protein n=1 Tax=Flavobacterium sp. TaxID=239 RepID=UPI000EBD7879|nr:hypothetical protein [Flavobacterium sp.]HCQ13952.1 hypothetical protein [Flavobacterium sp.]